MPTRREFLKMGAITGAALALPLDRASAFGAYATVPPFRVPLRIPPVLQPVRRTADCDYYVMTMRRARVEILPRKTTTIWGFDGRFPGPTMKVKKGRPVVVRRINRLGVPANAHLHGGKVAPAHDGHPTDLIEPGDRRKYVYWNDQDSATLWYHDHAHHHTSRNNYMGLSGLYIIEDEEEERDLNLPRGRFDIPLILQDRSFRRDGSFRFRDRHNNVVGDTLLVNGRPTPYFKVANRKYRFRILNAANSRGYELALSSGEPLVQIASDGGFLATPHMAATIPLWPSERAEVVIDFSKYAVGSQVVLVDKRDPVDPAQQIPIMRFDVEREEPDDSSIPSTLRQIERFAPGLPDRRFDLTINSNELWTIDHKPFNPRRIDARPRRGDTEIWEFRNLTSVTHPMHIHLVKFQILERSDLAISGGELGWKDTVRVDPSRNVRVAMRFERFTGRYVFHCHNLAHENHSMMGQMKVVA